MMRYLFLALLLLVPLVSCGQTGPGSCPTNTLVGNNGGGLTCLTGSQAGGVIGVGPSPVTSVNNYDGTLTISPATGGVIASLNLAHADTWTALQTFNGRVNISPSAPLTTGTSTLTVGNNPWPSGVGGFDCCTLWNTSLTRIGSTLTQATNVGNSSYDEFGTVLLATETATNNAFASFKGPLYLGSYCKDSSFIVITHACNALSGDSFIGDGVTNGFVEGVVVTAHGAGTGTGLLIGGEFDIFPGASDTATNVHCDVSGISGCHTNIWVGNLSSTVSGSWVMDTNGNNAGWINGISLRQISKTGIGFAITPAGTATSVFTVDGNGNTTGKDYISLAAGSSSWFSNDSPPVNFASVADKVLVGDAVNYPNNSGCSTGDWFSIFEGTTSNGPCAYIGGFNVVSESKPSGTGNVVINWGGGMFAGQTKNCGVAGCGSIGLMGFELQNNTNSTPANGGFAIYGECDITQNNGGNCFGIEVDVGNLVGSSALGALPNPFQQTLLVGMQIGCGSGISNTQLCGAAMQIVPNTSPFAMGINFLTNSVSPTTNALGSAPIALAFPHDYALVWYKDISTPVAAINADSSGNVNITVTGCLKVNGTCVTVP